MECPSFVLEKTAQSERAEFLRHLAACAGCQRDVEEMDDLRALYRSASIERYRGGVPRVRRGGWGSWLSAGAAASVMIAVLVFLLSHAPSATKETVAKAAPFFRVPLEPWRADVRLDGEFDDCWLKLDRLERSR
jgi:anti-sigma factor RsiW